MIQIKGSQYDLLIDKENQNIEFTLGNLSDAGWYWSRTSEDDILLFFFRLYKSTVWDEFLSRLKEEAEANKEDWDWFIERISNPSVEMKRQFMYGYLGDNNYKDYIESAITSIESAITSFVDLPTGIDGDIHDDEVYKEADKVIDEETWYIYTYDKTIMEFVKYIKELASKIPALDNLEDDRVDFWDEFVGDNLDKIYITVDDELGDEININKAILSLQGDGCDGCAREVARLLAMEYANKGIEGFTEMLDWIGLQESTRKFDWSKYRDSFVDIVENNHMATIDENTLNYLDNYIFEKFGDAPQLFNKGE